ncbi:chitinase glycoside hydrolase family 18, partial [Zymoseptoria tritici IPO323]
SRDKVAVYWGQNSFGSSGQQAQQSLATYCANTDIDIIPISFLLQMSSGQGGVPVVNFANSGNGCGTFAGTQLLDCPQISKDIQTCQDQYKKTILLSIGGATYTEGGFKTEQAAVNMANLIWNMFGPPGTAATVLRPFHSVSVDGFDLDIEAPTQNFVPFAKRLRALMNAANTDANLNRQFYLTVAPQCPYPDVNNDAMLNGGVEFDAVFVQFYNNYCGIQSFIPGAATQWNYNFDTWNKWAVNGSANPNVKVFIGVPAGPTAAGSGYLSVANLKPVIEYSKKFSSFGGIMAWDASQAYVNTGFLSGIKAAL